MTYLSDPWDWWRLTRDEQVDLMAYHREITSRRSKKAPAAPADPVARRSEFEERLRAYQESRRG